MPLVRSLLSAALAILFLLAVLVLFSVALGVALAVGAAAWVWLWWRARSLPRRRTLEGEYRDVTDLERLEDRNSERL